MSRLTLLAAGMAVLGIARAAEPGATNSTGFELAVVDMQGNRKVLGTLPSAIAPRVSPDGRRVAYEQSDPPAGPGEPALTRIYVASLDKPDSRRALQVTVLARRNVYPVWSPESDYVAFVATGNGSSGLFWQRADGWIQPLYLVDGAAPEAMYDGGKLTGGLLTFLTLTGEKDYGISLLDVDTRQVTRLVDVPGSAQYSGAISPDGHWLAYTSDETGRAEVWLESLPENGRHVQLTKNGGGHPEWSPDGKNLYFDQGGQIFRMDVSADSAGPRTGDAVALPIKGFQQTELRRQYDLTPDGKGFLMLFPVGGSGG